MDIHHDPFKMKTNILTALRMQIKTHFCFTNNRHMGIFIYIYIYIDFLAFNSRQDQICNQQEIN